MNNLCRAFTFFHDKLVVNTSNESIESLLKKDYIVVGYFDWFCTKILNLSDYSKNSLTELFSYNSDLNESNSELQSFQNVFGFIENNEIEKDIAFWNSNSDKILNFVMFLQFENYNENCFKFINEVLESDDFKECENIVYHTLDKNDFVICFKSNLYKETIVAINKLYTELRKKELNIIYSYTNFTIRYDIINNSTLTGTLREIIDSICIKTILNNYNVEPLIIPGKIELFCKELAASLYGSEEVDEKINNKEIVGYEILGDTDCRFIARGVPIKRLLHLYSKKGLLMRDNPDYKFCFVSSMTSLNIVLDYKASVTFDELNKDNKSNKSSISKTKDRIDNLKKDLNDEFNPIITLLCQINNYILFADKQTSKYELNSLYKPFQTLLNLLDDNISQINDEFLDIDELYDHLTNIYTNIQENIRTDIRFYGISDFCMMSYYSPTKLRAFYFFIISEISSYYSDMCHIDSQKNYSFLLFFSHVQTTYVNQLWKNKLGDNKLMMVKISEKDLYNIKDLIFQLAHEAAHFVGNEEVRRRENRYYYILENLFHMIYNLFYDSRSGLSEKAQKHIEKEVINFSFKRFYEKNNSIIHTFTEEFAKKLAYEKIIDTESSFFYSKNVDEYIESFLFDKNLLISIFSEYMQDLVKNIEEKMIYEGKEEIKEMRSIISELKDFINKFQTTINNYKWDLLYSEDSDYNYIQSLMYESYADLSAVFLFDLSVEEYFDIIFIRLEDEETDGNENDDQYYVQNILFQRACIVSLAMSEIGASYKTENNESFSNFFKSIPESWECIEKRKKMYDIVKKTCDNIKSNITHHLTYLYVRDCLAAHCKQHNKDKREKLKNMYKKIGKEDVVEVVKDINEYVAKAGEQ